MRPIFDVAEWRKNQAENFIARQDALIAAAAALEPGQRTQARIDLARFYMSRGMYPEAKGVPISRSPTSSRDRRIRSP